MSVKRINDFRSSVLTEFERGSSVGEPSGLPFLDNNLKIRPGFFYTVTGWPSSGKSEFVLNLAILQARNKRRVVFYSPESYPVESFIATMAQTYLGKATDKHYPNVCSLDEYTAALDWLHEWFFLCSYDDSPNHEVVLEDFKLLRTAHNCKVFVLDPFNSLTGDDESGGNMAVQLKDVLNKFVLFTHTERVIFFCIEHPKTPRDHEDVKKVPGPYQLFGGSMWWNKSDCVFAVHSFRDSETGYYTGQVVIKVWKMKNQKLNGVPGEVQCYFDVKTNRYYQTKPVEIQKEIFAPRNFTEPINGNPF